MFIVFPGSIWMLTNIIVDNEVKRGERCLSEVRGTESMLPLTFKGQQHPAMMLKMTADQGGFETVGLPRWTDLQRRHLKTVQHLQTKMAAYGSQDLFYSNSMPHGMINDHCEETVSEHREHLG